MYVRIHRLRRLFEIAFHQPAEEDATFRFYYGRDLDLTTARTQRLTVGIRPHTHTHTHIDIHPLFGAHGKYRDTDRNDDLNPISVTSVAKQKQNF